MNRTLAVKCPAVLVVLALLVVTAGCVQESQQGDATKFTYALWAPLCLIGASVAGLGGGWFMRASSERAAWAFMLLGGMGVLYGPTMFLDYAIVDARHCEARTGIPFFASQESVNFDDVQGVRHATRISRGRRGRKTTNHYFNFDLKNGGTVEMRVSGHIRQEALVKLTEQLRSRGISIVDQGS